MAGEDPKYVEWIRAQTCCACGGAPPCEPHHSTNGQAEQTPKSLGGRRGKGQRAHDHEAMPLHTKCHRQFHDLRGPFEGWDKARIRAWQDEQVRIHRARYEAEQGAPEAARPTSTKARPTLRQEAEGFRSLYPMIGPQGQHDLERLLKRVAKGAVF